MQPILLIHGGAGTIQRAKFTPERLAEFTAALTDIARAGQQVLLTGGSAVDAVTEAVRLLENNPLFNAGKGSVLTAGATHEMDACIMDGRDKSAGAVTCVSHIKNPVLAAQAVMRHSPHVCFSGAGAEAFAQQHGIEMMAADYFMIEQRLTQLHAMQAENKISLDHDGENALQAPTDANPIREKDKYGTVGAVALDRQGNLAAATSTGGLTNKAVGRVGDTPMIGAGCYADDLCAISTTGIGETFMRSLLPYDIASRMRYGGASLSEAVDAAFADTFPGVGGEGGLIVIDKAGNFALPMNTAGMYRAEAIGDKSPMAKVFRDE